MRVSTALGTLLGVNCAWAAAVLPRDISDAIPSLGDDQVLLLLKNGSTTACAKDKLASYFGDDVHLSDPSLTETLPLHLESRRSSPLSKRGSGNVDLIIPLSDQTFLGWDVSMSTVVFANQAAATLSVMSGQNIANSITYGTSGELTLVEDFLKISASVDYQKTTTSLVSGTATMTVPANKWGVIVSNPLTHRKRGYVYSGQPGQSTFDYFQADSFDDASFSLNGGTLSWVSGTVTTCLRDTYPIQRCNGEGVLE